MICKHLTREEAKYDREYLVRARIAYQKKIRALVRAINLLWILLFESLYLGSMMRSTLVPPDEALEIILRFLPEMGSEAIPIERSRGRVLCEEIVANEDIPRYANSSMDGFAVAARSTSSAAPTEPCVLRIVGESSAGRPYVGTWDPSGECIRIMTGAVIPEGADSVVERELVSERGQLLTLEAPVPIGKSIRLAGEDVRSGHVAIPLGGVIKPEHIGVMASLGYTEVGVVQRPSVTIITTGSELVHPGSVPEPGSVRNASRYMIPAYVEDAGGTAMHVREAGDEKDVLKSVFAEAWDSDAVITTGGISAGKYDLVLDALKESGAECKFAGVNIKPGKPFAFCTARNGTPVFCLPGNPVSSAVTFWRFVRPAIGKMTRRKDLTGSPLTARLEEEVQKKDSKVHYLRGIYSSTDGALTVRRTGTQSSGALTSVAMANCLIVLPPEQRTYTKGEHVEIFVI